MRRNVFFGLLLSTMFALPLCAQDQQEQSLGDIARQARKAKEKGAREGPFRLLIRSGCAFARFPNLLDQTSSRTLCAAPST